ncbi:MAG: hypothetical protein ABIJ82_01000 [Patescibacteria group bacterium]
MSYREEKYKSWLESSQGCNKDFNNFLRKSFVVEIEDGEIWKGRYLEKANHNLDFASLVTGLHKTVIKEKFPNRTFYDWVTIAYYYAIYHAALALISKAGLKSKSHLATLCGTINYYYHKEKRLEKKHIDILGRNRKNKHRAVCRDPSSQRKSKLWCINNF